MQHCLFDPSIVTSMQVCEPCRRAVFRCVRQELPSSPARLARVLVDEVDEIADHVLDATLCRVREGDIPDASLVAWVVRCCKNRVLDRVRYWNADRRSIERELDATRGRDALAALREPTHPGAGIVTRLDMADELLDLKRALSEFEGPEVEAIRLRYLSGEEPTWKQLAEKVGFGADGGERLRVRVQAFLPKLRERVSKRRDASDH
ncbi:MAG: sigma-70 family RNA polymerase sigma factor [Planctomycetes bacterium]|nr:sigma-70 family RNA polymerase sigma factor [Planctomycetota bacterium]MCB9916812.1 sigma-70 family RNA polymerase sigma factor [Planctomycetota bacterium]